MAEHRRKVVVQFSGTLCVDELHLGRLTLLLATDPLSHFPVAFALVATNDQNHMLRFLKNLKNWGLMPRVVVTDDSSLYPAVLAELWPDAAHQLCVFHIIKNINERISGRSTAATGGHEPTGRQGSQEEARPQKQAGQGRCQARGPTLKQKASFVFKHRFLIVKRRKPEPVGA